MGNWVDYFGFISLILTVLLIGGIVRVGSTSTAALTDLRRQLTEAQLEAQMTRSMLDARARIQVINVRANLENRRLTDDEIAVIKQNWIAAEYHRVGVEIK